MSKSVQADNSSSKPDDNKSGKGAKPATSGKPDKKPGKPGEPPREGSRSGWILAFLAFLIALVGLVLDFTLWQWGDVEFDEFDARIETVERALEKNGQDAYDRVSRLKSEQSALQSSISELQSKVRQMGDSLDQTRLQTSDLSDKVEGGRTRWKLLEIEGLLLAANERLQLHRDIEGAVEALSVASLRLARLNDPRLFDLRSRVTEEISTLESLPRPDIEGLALKLSSLMQQMPEWPLASNVPDSFVGSGESDGEGQRFTVDSWARFKQSLYGLFDELFTVRRSEGTYEPLMPPQQEFFLRQNLLLKLQTARLALLQRNTTAYRNSLEEARTWLDTFFTRDAAAVKNALDQLSRMQRAELAWREPDISGSLTGLREYLRQLGRGETLPGAESITAPPAQSALGKPKPAEAAPSKVPAKQAPAGASSAEPADKTESPTSTPDATESEAGNASETGDADDAESDSVKAPAGRLDDGINLPEAEEQEAAD